MARPYGQTGHRTIGAIAQMHLSKTAEKAVHDLLSGHSLAYASTYMDEVKSDPHYDHTHDWHWVTIPDGSTYAQAAKNPDGDLIEALRRMKAALSNPSKTKEEKTLALQFLVHLMGDLHQPLHVGNGTDRGGNDVRVKWFGRSSNLHRVWDSDMLKSREWSYSELANELQRTMPQDQVQKWQEGSFTDWAEENMPYRSQVYAIGNPDRMGYRYTYQNWDLLMLQMQKAGIRLAAVLNEVLG